MCNLEMLEGRRLMSTAPMGVTATGTLWVQGTDGDDVIVVTASGSTFTVGMNVMQGFEFTGVHRVWIEGSAGKDRIVYRGAPNLPVRLLGGGGRDTLHGEGPQVTLSGGDGNDDLVAEGTAGVALVGGRGGDRLFGAAGSDTFFGCAGDDYATTVHPDDVLLDNIERMMAVSEASRHDRT
jgi:Ca2+-binding RTX toxin-like protein